MVDSDRVDEERKALDKTLKDMKIAKKDRVAVAVSSSDRKRLIVAVFVSFLLISSLVLFFLWLSDSSSDPVYSDGDIASMIYALDGRAFECSRSDYDEMAELLGVEFSGHIITKSLDGEHIAMTFGFGKDERSVIFAFNSGKLVGNVGRKRIFLQYSESYDGGGETLTLIGDDYSIPFALST